MRHGVAIDKASFRDLCAGIDPRTGRGLVRGAGENHRAGWDVTFSAPKSLSLLWAAGTDAQRAEVEALQAQAVDAALRFVVRQQLLEVRLGAGGILREQPTDVIAGRFRHTTSRAGDPNLHTHCVLMNVAGSADGKHRTLEPDALFKWTLTVGAAYRAELAMLLANRGFTFRPAGRDQIEIRGVDEDLIETFSKRSRMIEEVVGDRATASGARKELAALATRQGKETLPTGPELEARWTEEFAGTRDQLWTRALAAAHEPARAFEKVSLGTGAPGLDRGGDAERVEVTNPTAPINGASPAAVGEDLEATRADHTDGAVDPDHYEGPRLDPVPVVGDSPVARAASKLLSHDSVVDRRAVLRHSLVAASRRGIGIAAVESELDQLQADRSLLTLREGRSAAWTTEHIAEREAAMRAACRRADERSFFRANAVAEALDAAPNLSDEQRVAAEGAVGRDGVSLVEAGAGTGKTTLASAIKQAADRSGLRTISLAPTWLAADELAKSIGIPAFAVAKWRYDREITPSLTDGRGFAVPELPPLDNRTLVLLDEAGMLGVLDMAAVLTAAKAAGAKVIAFGDRRQLDAVAQGSALAAVADELSRVEVLSVIRRQHHAWQRAASLAMSEGRFEEALAAYHEQGAIRFAANAKTAVAETVGHWRALRAAHGTDVPIVTRSNRDAVSLNLAARQSLRDAGELAGPDVLVPAVDRRNRTVPLALAVNDQIRFGANLKAHGIRNGTQATIMAAAFRDDKGGPLVRVRLEDGRTVEAPWSDFAPQQRGRSARPLPRVVHAYAGTVHSVQGRTAEAAVFHVGAGTDARETYVALTRHRETVRVVVDADRLLREATAAVDLSQTDEAAKLAAFALEASRFDAKPNVADLAPRPPEPSVRLAVPRHRDRGLDLTP